MNYRELMQKGVARLTEAGITDARLDAGLLLEHLLGTDRNYLYVHGESPVSDEQCEAYDNLLAKREERIPLQQIIGSTDFMGLTFTVNDRVLCPRQDTECLVEEALIVTNDGDRVLDLCTGSGCILISIMRYKNEIDGVGVDLSEDALQLARINAEHNGVNPLMIKSDLFAEVEGIFDVIVSNPPYIRPEVIETLEPEVKDHEPRMALYGGADGLDFYRRIIREAPAYLRKGGYLLFEIGYDQGDEVSGLMEESGYHDVRVVKDLAGLNRVVMGQTRIK